MLESTIKNINNPFDEGFVSGIFSGSFVEVVLAVDIKVVITGLSVSLVDDVTGLNVVLFLVDAVVEGFVEVINSVVVLSSEVDVVDVVTSGEVMVVKDSVELLIEKLVVSNESTE